MRVGFVGWRGMVGSVLMARMRECGDFDGIEPVFFSTSAAGKSGPTVGGQTYTLESAFDLDTLRKLPVIVTCQGGDYTLDIYPKLRAAGWDGYFIDAARALRMSDDAVLILDPVNRKVIEQGLGDGKKTFCGPNCTVSLMLMATQGLFDADLVEWVSSMTYQAASGGGAAHMRELVAQMAHIAGVARGELEDPAVDALALDAAVMRALGDVQLPTERFGAPLAASLLPWIDAPVERGQTREEWKAFSEGNKILGRTPPVPIDGVCVRVGSMRCHAQALTLKLKRAAPLTEILERIAAANEWVKLVANDRAATLAGLTPAAVSGKLDVAVGRVRKMLLGEEYLTLFTVGDQLLWGAAEPLRRMLGILREHGVS